MDPPRKLLPGPVGTSCLTCKRRHKKCDRRKPICERCSKGGYECLGYDHSKSSRVTCGEPPYSDGIQSTTNNSYTTLSLCHSISPPPSISVGENYSGNDGPTAQIEVQREEDVAINPQTHDVANDNETFGAPNVTRPPPHNIPGPLAYYVTDSLIHDTFPPTKSNSVTRAGNQPYLNPGIPSSQQHMLLTSPLLIAFASRIPTSLSLPSDIREIMKYVRSYFDRMVNFMYFKPRKEHIDAFQHEAMWRISTCGFARRSMLLEAKITNSVLEGSDAIYFNSFTLWIAEFEQELHNRIAQPLTSGELQERLTNIPEVLLLKVVLFNASTTYQLLCRMVPSFLQTVFSDPTLKPNEHNSGLVSIAHLLASPRFGPAYFMLMDVMASMIYGAPQLVGYNPYIEPFHDEPHAIEWIDCFPGEFQIMLARINICRDQGPLGENWKDIEQWLLLWMSRPKFELKALESWKTIAWIALQETWRQTLLIYLYLVVCGVPTDDSRVQSSLKQLIRLIGSIRRQEPPIANVHLFAQLLIACICSRTEKRRRLIRERLGCAAETRFWMFRGPEIVPVLDHLWRGEAAGGRAIVWGDYMKSRRIMLPLPTEAVPL